MTGKTKLPLIKLPFGRKPEFMGKMSETHHGIQAMDEAISELSLECNPADSSRALYLLSAPASEMNMDLVKELGDSLSGIASEAIIRYGDYPIKERKLTVTVIMSQFRRVDTIMKYYNEFPNAADKIEKIESDIELILDDMNDASFKIPSLLK